MQRLFTPPPLHPPQTKFTGEGRTSEAKFGEGNSAQAHGTRDSRKDLPGKLAKRSFTDPPDWRPEGAMQRLFTPPPLHPPPKKFARDDRTSEAKFGEGQRATRSRVQAMIASIGLP
ncbi:hypothetical protein CA51_08250 [Rosistilla oblonga]|nr:hypothetical protein CA51_08250 [Rosistilla oblonga]